LGLLLFRLAAGISLIGAGVTGFSNALGDPISVGSHLAAAFAGVFLLAGLWTPVVGALAALYELWSAFSVYSGRPEEQWIHILLMLMTAGIAMLGPGAWSIDARLYGRKRFDIVSRGR
jgi:uncharacterized membrane protein YphA (DoxX/SURF4 family)